MSENWEYKCCASDEEIEALYLDRYCNDNVFSLFDLFIDKRDLDIYSKLLYYYYYGI